MDLGVSDLECGPSTAAAFERVHGLIALHHTLACRRGARLPSSSRQVPKVPASVIRISSGTGRRPRPRGPRRALVEVQARRTDPPLGSPRSRRCRRGSRRRNEGGLQARQHRRRRHDELAQPPAPFAGPSGKRGVREARSSHARAREGLGREYAKVKNHIGVYGLPFRVKVGNRICLRASSRDMARRRRRSILERVLAVDVHRPAAGSSSTHQRSTNVMSGVGASLKVETFCFQ